MEGRTNTELIVFRDRLVMSAALTVIVALAWTYLLLGAGTGMDPSAMTTLEFPPPRPQRTTAGSWDPGYWLIMLIMWWVMMVAMMVPSAAPMILLHGRVWRHAHRAHPQPTPVVPSAWFLLGYLACWFAFSALATLFQFVLERAGLMDGMLMWATNRTLTAGLLAAGGAFQFSGLKETCLAHCRSPAETLAHLWRPGRTGAFRMGLSHGAHCLGCCWALMLLLFAGGVMNLIWIAALTVLVLIEKLAPRAVPVRHATGVSLLAAALYLIATAP